MSNPETAPEAATSEIGITEKQFHCPVHGNIGSAVFSSTLKGREGNWCLGCYVEWVDRNVIRATEIGTTK